MKIIIAFVRLFWKEVLIVLLSLIASSAIGIAINSNVKNNRAIAILEHSRDSAYNVARYYKNREGQLIGQIKTHEITISELKDFSGEIGIEVEGLKRQIGSLNRLVARWQAEVNFKDTGTITVPIKEVIVEGEPVEEFKWNNEHLSLSGYIRNKKVNLSYEYDLKFDMELTAYWKKERVGFLKYNKTLVTDIKFSDQHIRVGEFKGVVIKQPPVRWYETKWFSYGIGAIAGIIVYEKVFK